ncbi:putative damage-inducible protein DinB [Sinobacterium caligoides]|uniref:Putative damage-inducible protein DinB n=2 Tax=Sinobacterium caligoides TaxID=933926 RepID=A0A3N2DDQ5_9GAMM|nr:putative damage-inducible protein DinB [Sinobacterium caligoides]
MSLKSNFELMAAYNQRINSSIYNAAATLSSDELKRDRGAFFSSIIGTLNHIIVGDTIWLKRFANHPASFPSLDYIRALDTPLSLDAIIYPQFSALTAARNKMDDVIVQLTSELSDDDVACTLEYSNTKGLVFRKNFGALLQHLFNHQTHHRGQVSTLLFQAGIDIGATDLLMNIADVESPSQA